MIGSILQAGASHISEKVLEIRNFKDKPFNGSSIHVFTGKTDAVYLGDLQEFVKEKAASNSSIMHKVHFTYIKEGLLAQLQTHLTAIETNPAATEQQLAFAIKITDTLRKAEEVQQQNNDKARACLEILFQCVTQSVNIILRPTVLQYPGQEEKQLYECLKQLKNTFPVSAYEIKQAMNFDVDQIGIASTYASMQTLLVALQMQQQRQHSSLTIENPNVLLQQEGLKANIVAIQAHALQIAGYAAANAALAVGHPPLIPDLVLPFPVPLADQALGAHNLQCNYYQGGIDEGDNPILPGAFAYPPAMVLPIPPPRCLLDPSVLEKTNHDWLMDLRDKTESNTTSVVSPLRAIVIQALIRQPHPSLSDVAQEITQYIAINPQSNNHTCLALHTALAKQQGHFMGRAHAAQETTSLDVQPHDSVSYVAFATKDQAEAMTDEELGQKRRMELAGPWPGRSCHFWGYQQGELVCGKEKATGSPCQFAHFHNANHQGPPQKQFGPPAAGGQYL